MKTNILIFVIFLSFLNVPIFGQIKSDTVNINKNSVKYKYALGGGVGYTTGYGISFRFKPNKFGIQTNLYSYYNDYKTKFNIGLTFLYTLIDAEKTSLYLYQGNHFKYSSYDYNYDGYSRISKTNEFNNGVGFGIEFIILKSVGLNIMGGYAFYDNFERLDITGEAGLYYKF